MRKEKLELIKSLDLIIIDEVSMVRADVMDRINDELQRIRCSVEPFGGVQLLMIGDLQQLPPVATAEDLKILTPYYDSMYFFDSNALRNSDYYCIELKKVYRQSDQHFIDILNRVRADNVTTADLEELNSHYIAGFRPSPEENYIHLVTHNQMANYINQREMDSLPGRKSVFNAEVSGTFQEEAFPTNAQLEVKKGAQVMFVKNDPEKKYVNGTLGKVEDVYEDRIEVKTSRGDSVTVEPVIWENIRYGIDKETKKIESTRIGTFKQFPIKAAWAITVHKGQGLTFDKAVIDAHSAFSPGQVYVALSRCRSLDGIVLGAKISRKAIMTDSIVDDYMKGAVQDIDALAEKICFEPFDYERTLQNDEPDGNTNHMQVIVYNKIIFDALKDWRFRTAREASIPAYSVMPDRTLAELASIIPDTVSELDGIFGLRSRRIEKYGTELLEVIRSSSRKESDNVSSPDTGVFAVTDSPKDISRAANKEKTWAISYEMYKQGMSVEQIAQERSLTQNTILGHLSRYVSTGDIDVHTLVSDENIEKVTEYMLRHSGNDASLKPIFDYFNGTIPYSDIRLVLAYMQRP